MKKTNVVYNFKADDAIEGKINEEVLCVLKKDKTNQIVIGYVDIINPFKNIVEKLTELCDKPETSIQQILSFIHNTKSFEQLTAHYKYCVSLKDAFQGFSANSEEFKKEINQRYKLILFHMSENPDNYDIQKVITGLKSEIKAKYSLWSKAYSINKSYRQCEDDKSILTFSHRIDGWSNPLYQLTPNFSVEIKTNFGYGSVSYFYTNLKYKHIEITPFSEWIEYEFAQFSEIIRYTQSYPLENKYWLEAMKFARDACNLSLTNEVAFVEKYIIKECEKMVSGLEDLFNKEKFTFKSRDRRKYSVDKTGHVLVEFRGEKVSGALDFISKILEFEKITAIETFLMRIEDCNRKIQPILDEEAEILNIKIENLTKEKNELLPKYEEVVKINTDYNSKRRRLQAEMIDKGKLNVNQINTQKLVDEFMSKFPDYVKFEEEYKCVTEGYKLLNQQIKNLTKVRKNIIVYNAKITKHFDK